MSADNLYSEISKTRDQFNTLLAGYWKKGLRPVVVNLGTFSDGTRYAVFDQYRDTQFYLVTTPTAYIASGGAAGGPPVTRTGFAAALDVGFVVRPAYSLTTAVSQSGNWFVKINSTGVAAPSGGQFTTNGLGTAQLLSGFTNPPPGFADTFILENLDAVNTVWVGASTVTNAGANIGFPITKGLTSPPIQNSSPANLWIVDSGAAVTMAWLAM